MIDNLYNTYVKIGAIYSILFFKFNVKNKLKFKCRYVYFDNMSKFYNSKIF